MVILIASDQHAVCQTLADHLAAGGMHRIYSAETMADLEEAVGSLEELDVLLFSAGLAGGRGKDVRDQLRAQFPGLQAVNIATEDGGTVPPEQVSAWLKQVSAAAAAAEEATASPVALADYELKEKRRTTETTETFRAVQRSVNREVVLERLRPELQKDKAAAKAFRAMVRARAAVSCPWIAAVYEAQETQGSLFYTRELVRGSSVEQLAAARAHIQPEEALHLLRAAAESVQWLAEKGVARSPLERRHVYLGSDGAPRVANIAIAEAVPLQEAREIREMAAGLMKVVVFKGAAGRELSHVLGLMSATGPHALASWRQVLRESRTAIQRITEARTSSLAEGKDAAVARRRKSRAPYFVTLVLLLGGAGGAAFMLSRKKPAGNEKLETALLPVPAGEFTFRDGQRVMLPAYWIDSHEVTIGQYAEFLEAAPGAKFNHPDQPKTITSHEPKEWSSILNAARSGSTWQGCRVTLNSPVFNVTWWDAHAYASWKGRRLPTEQEWEKAARGTNGNAWPWGPAADPKRANLGTDYAETPAGGGGADGHTWWCDVNAMPEDISPYDVVGMAGNVSEWTATLAPHPEDPDKTVPVFRGGDFHQPSPQALTTPWLAKSPDYAQPFLGFRTVSSKAP
jgi:formylglycine-generating enzyme required for sulfatase activity